MPTASAARDGPRLPEDLAAELARWADPRVHGAVLGGLASHFPEGGWRLLDAPGSPA